MDFPSLALFGWSVGLARHRFGFNLSVVAVLWVGLELGLLKLGFVSGIFGKGGLSDSSPHGLVGLFGFLAVSAIIVLLNSLLVLAIVRTLEVRRAGGGLLPKAEVEGGFSLIAIFASKTSTWCLRDGGGHV